MEELIKKSVSKTVDMAKEYILNKSLERGLILIKLRKGVRNWYCYPCTSCSDISIIAENEIDSYLTKESGRHTFPRYYEISCPKCGNIHRVTFEPRDIGIVRFACDEENIIGLKCKASTYPDTELVTSCKLTDLSYKDVCVFVDEISQNTFWGHNFINDETDWNYVFYRLVNADLKNEPTTYSMLQDFIESLDSLEDEYKLICYLVAKKDKNLLKCITECTNDTTLRLLKKQFMIFGKNKCPQKSIRALKNVVKKANLITEKDFSCGDIFTLPLSVVEECDSIEKFDALRKIYNKSKDEDDFKRILDGAAISDDSKYLNALRVAIEKIPSFSSEKIANICIMQYVFTNYQFATTCQMLSRNKDKALENVEFFKPNLVDIDTITKANKSTFNNIREDKEDIIEEEGKVFNDVNPDETVLFYEDMYELEKDIKVIADVCERESFYFSAIKNLYEKGIAYIFTNQAKDKYVFARESGKILLKGKFA